MSDVVKQVAELIEGTVEAEECSLVDVGFLRDDRGWVLRVYIEKEEGGLLLDDCSRVSRQISAILDVHDVISRAYRLEVSSPGVKRPLKKKRDFVRFAGQKITLRTIGKLDGQRRFSGILQGLDGDEILLKTGKELLNIPLDRLQKVHLDPDLASLLNGRRR